jgi:trans-aconitate methyltransferase
MDLGDPRTFELFLEIYGTLPRAGPGSTADTLRALSMIPGAELKTVLDLGCGPGAQTVVLAEALPEAKILALDLVPSMVAEARRRCTASGFGDRVRVEVGDMMSVDVPEGSQDLIWCEGAIYFAGVESGLRRWRPLLEPGGTVAFTEAIWIQRSPPDEVVEWWRSHYPAITDEEGVRKAIVAAGYDTVGCFVLPADSWWDDYYEPMVGRIEEFRALHPEDPTAAEIATEAEKEIAMFKAFLDSYSYGFFVVQPGRDS